MTRHVLGVVDSDSFVKWGANLLSGAPDDWAVDLVSIATRASASAAQLANAVNGAGVAAASVTTIANVSGICVGEISHCSDRSFLWKKYTTT